MINNTVNIIIKHKWQYSLAHCPIYGHSNLPVHAVHRRIEKQTQRRQKIHLFNHI